jgi:hypothetical protein
MIKRNQSYMIDWYMSEWPFFCIKIRVLAIVDNFTRLSAALDIEHSYDGGMLLIRLSA